MASGADCFSRLEIACEGSYFPYRIHEAFNPSNFRLLEWKYPSAFDYRDLHGTTLILSGTLSFVKIFSDRLRSVQSVVLQVFTPMEGVSVKTARRTLAAVSKFMKDQGLQEEGWIDARAGGCTDATYQVGFRSQFELNPVPTSNSTIERSLVHFLDPKVSPFDATRVTKSLFADLEGLPPVRRPMRGKSVQGALLPQGLLALHDRRELIMAPSVYHPGLRILRRVSVKERLRMHQSPLELDAFIEQAGGNDEEARSWRLVQEISESLTPDMYVSLFRQLWLIEGGGRRIVCVASRFKGIAGGGAAEVASGAKRQRRDGKEGVTCSSEAFKGGASSSGVFNEGRRQV